MWKGFLKKSCPTQHENFPKLLISRNENFHVEKDSLAGWPEDAVVHYSSTQKMLSLSLHFSSFWPQKYANFLETTNIFFHQPMSSEIAKLSHPVSHSSLPCHTQELHYLHTTRRRTDSSSRMDVGLVNYWLVDLTFLPLPNIQKRNILDNFTAFLWIF